MGLTRRAMRVRDRAFRIGLWGLAATTVTQVAVAGSLLLIDSMRKKRVVDVGQLSRTPPATIGVSGSTVTTYTYGVDLYEDMLTAIDSAQESVFLESYIWKSDDLGQRFKDAVIRAADRGVQVCVVFDGMGNLVVPAKFKRFPRHVHTLVFPTLRLGLLRLNIRDSGRDHRKILVVDRRVGFVGGYNLGSLYATQWRDTHVRVEGPAVWELSNAFVDFWNQYRDKDRPLLEDTGIRKWDPSITAHINAPSLMLFPVRGMYLDALNRANDRIWITQGYFIPDGDMLEALKTACNRGVDVRVLMPEISNHVVADWLARGYYSELMAAGVQIWLYKDAMVHAKTITVDGEWSSIGTANIDRLSLSGNYEINLGVYSRDLATQMEQIFENDLRNARQLDPDEWSRRSRVSRFSERVLAPLHPFF